MQISKPSESSEKRRRLVLLAPVGAAAPSGFRNVSADSYRRLRLLSSTQRLRGSVYVADGAISVSQLTADGRHEQESDSSAWHVLSVDSDGQVQGCARYRPYDATATFSQLQARNAAIGKSPEWALAFRMAIAAEMRRARENALAFVEVGGWALSPQTRCCTDALKTALATFALSRLLGGCVGITTATTRHSSSSILRRIGGRSLSVGEVELPKFYDPQYGCDMEILRFEASQTNQKYEPIVRELMAELAYADVYTSHTATQALVAGLLYTPQVKAAAAAV